MRNQYLEDLIASIHHNPSGPKIHALRISIRSLDKKGDDVSDYKEVFMNLKDVYCLSNYKEGLRE